MNRTYVFVSKKLFRIGLEWLEITDKTRDAKIIEYAPGEYAIDAQNNRVYILARGKNGDL